MLTCVVLFLQYHCLSVPWLASYSCRSKSVYTVSLCPCWLSCQSNTHSDLPPEAPGLKGCSDHSENHFYVNFKDCFCRRTYHIYSFLLHFLQKSCIILHKSFSFQSFRRQPPLLLTPCLLCQIPTPVTSLCPIFPFFSTLSLLPPSLVSHIICSFNRLFQVDAGGWGVLRQ